MKIFNKIIATVLVGGTVVVAFQNCSVPLESLAEKYDPNYQHAEESEDASQTPNHEDGTDLNLLKSGPVAYLYEPSSTTMVKDVCLSDNSYFLKVRNAGPNPKLCLTKQSDPSACVNNVSSFVSIAQAGYRLVGQDWVTDGMGHSLRQLILPSQAPMSLSLFYIDDANPIPRQVGGFSVHACVDKIVYNHVSFSCPSEDICANYFPQTSMEVGSCVPTTSGVRVTCAPRFVEPGSPRSGSFAKYSEPAISTGGHVADSGSTGTPNSGQGGASAGTNVGSGGSVPVNSECGNTPGVTIAQIKNTNGYFNDMQTDTVAPGTIMSFPFTLDLAMYPHGISFNIEAGINSGAYNMKDISISKCPGRFEGLSPQCLKMGTVANRIIAIPTDNVSTCRIEPGVKYYFNMRPSLEGQDAAAVLSVRAR